MSPHQSRIAVINEIADLQVVLAQAQSRMARLMQKVSEWDIPALDPSASPVLTQATTRALGNQGSDSEGESGPQARGEHEAGSGQIPAEEAQGRNEPASVEPAAGAAAGEGDEGLKPAPVPRDRLTKAEKILELWAEGNLIDKQIAAQVGSTVGTVNNIVARARKAGDPRAVSRRGSSRYATGAMEPTAPKPVELPAPVETDGRYDPAGAPLQRDPTNYYRFIGPLGGLATSRPTGELLGLLAAGEVVGLSDLVRRSSFVDTLVVSRIMHETRPKLAAIGIELFQPMQKTWQLRRAGK